MTRKTKWRLLVAAALLVSLAFWFAGFPTLAYVMVAGVLIGTV